MSALLRTVGLLAILAAAFLGWLWIGPAPSLSGAPADGASISLGELVRSFGPGFVYVVALACAASAAAGPGTPRGLRALLAAPPEAEACAASAALGRLARATVGAGLIVSLLAALAVFLLAQSGAPGNEPAPQDVARLLMTTLTAPIAALALGRLVLAPTADALAARAGERARAFAPREDLSLVLLALPALLAYLSALLPAAPL